MSTEEKTCTKCKQSKPLGLFGLSKNHKGGVNPWCKAFVVGALFGAWAVHLHREYIEFIKAREARKYRE